MAAGPLHQSAEPTPTGGGPRFSSQASLSYGGGSSGRKSCTPVLTQICPSRVSIGVGSPRTTRKTSDRGGQCRPLPADVHPPAGAQPVSRWISEAWPLMHFRGVQPPVLPLLSGLERETLSVSVAVWKALHKNFVGFPRILSSRVLTD